MTRFPRSAFVLFLSLSLLALAACTRLPTPAAPAAPTAAATVDVGAASRSVLPLVDGSYDYLAAGFPDRMDAFDPGIVVPEWDNGRVAVGNGDSDSYWVHDDVRVTALAVEDPATGKVVVLVASDLYMIFRQDADGIRAKAAALVPAGVAADMEVLVSATHNHHGPDTAFDVNHDWYEHMTDQAAAAVAEAVTTRQPATLHVASGEHYFGTNDGTDPQVFDPTMQVLQARATNGDVIATAVQWNNHPEVTLGWEPPADQITDDCVVLGLAGDDCRAEGRYFTADFPGIVREDLHARYGGEVLYFNGAVGVLVGPLGSDVWEVTEEHGLGNQLRAPAGATAPGGGTDYTARNFRRTGVIGEQAAAAAARLVDRSVPLADATVDYRVQRFVTRLTNFGFRVLLVIDPATGRGSLGHDAGELLVCPDAPADYSTCTSDGGQKARDDLVGVDYRVGDHIGTAVEYLHIGPVGMMFLPGEVAGELVIGLPARFRSAPQYWYEEPAGRHAFGDALTTPGFVRQRMHDPYEWVIGLGSDQLGYVIPIGNFRARCVLDEFVPGGCAQLYASGDIEYADAVAGTTCKAVTEDPGALAGRSGLAVLGITTACKYGQALGEAEGHYEETNSASWDLAQDMMTAVGAITGDRDPTQVNPDFAGWWRGYLPFGPLPRPATPPR